MWIFKYKPFTHRRIHFRDWSCKDKIIFNHISNHTQNFSHIGACTCAQEQKTCARSRFCILKRILEIGHVKTKLSLFIYLTTKKISAILEREHAHRSQKRTCVAVFSHAQLFSHKNMQTSRICAIHWKLQTHLENGCYSSRHKIRFWRPGSRSGSAILK